MVSYSRKRGLIFTASSIFYTGGPDRFIDIFQDTKFRPGVVPVLQRCYRERYALFLVCNVPEVLEGCYPLDSLYSFFNAVQDYWGYMGIKFVQIYYECNLKHRRALPSPRMLREVKEDFRYKADDLLIVGSGGFDEMAAEEGCFDFFQASDFFNTLVPKRQTED